MAKDDKNIAKRSNQRIMSILGLQRAQDIPELEVPLTQQGVVRVGQYSKAELRNLPGMNPDNREDITSRERMNSIDFLGYLKTSSDESRAIVQENKQLTTLTPEINKCKMITVSAIMSPTDLRTDAVIITTEVPDLSQVVNEKIGVLLTEFFNNDLEFGIRLSKWIGTALYVAGSQPVIVAPRPTITVLNKAVDLDNKIKGLIVGQESLEHFLPRPQSNDMLKFSDSIEDAAITLLESNEAMQTGDFSKLDLDGKRKIMSTAKDGVVKLIRDNQNAIILSQDPKDLLVRKASFESTVEKQRKELEKYFFGDNTNPTFILPEDDDLDKDSQPVLIEIPPEAVVPVCIPGTKSEHIGYFILTDEWDTPITVEAANQISIFGSKRLTQSSMDAVFGRPISNVTSNKLTDGQRFEAAATVFGLTVKNLLERKLENIGLSGVDIQRHEAITKCMFHYLLQKKQVKLIYVPEPIMSYYRFDHRDDGTGKSLLEDISYVLALRTTLVVAGIMAATKDAMDRKIIEVNVDDKNVNVLKTLDQVRNIFTEKNMLRFDNNPMTVARDIINKSLTIIPRGIKGLQDSLNVSWDNRNTSTNKPDNDLIDKLTNWAIDGLNVPHSALNQLSETEYARSIMSNNLFFSNTIRDYQRQTCKHGTKTIRTYMRYSAPLQESILKILKDNQMETEDKSTSGEMGVAMNDDTDRKNLAKVIRYTKMTLPTPNVATSKAQFEEIEKFISMVDTVIERIYPNEAVINVMDGGMGGQDGRTELLTAIKTMVKASVIRDYIKDIGAESILQVPELSEFSPEKLEDLQLQLANMRRSVDALLTNIKPPIEDPNSPDNQDYDAVIPAANPPADEEGELAATPDTTALPDVDKEDYKPGQQPESGPEVPKM